MRAEHNIDIHGGGHTLVGNTITIFLHYLQTSAVACALMGHWNLSGIGVQYKKTVGKMKKNQILAIYEGTYQCPVFCSKITSRTLLSCKSVNIYFLPLTYFPAGNLGQSDKEQTHFLSPHKRCSHNYWELHWQKQSQKVWALQVCNVRVAKKVSDYNL